MTLRGDPQTPVVGRTDTDDGTLEVNSVVLGRRRIRPDEVFHFEDGLFGFPECRRFALIPTARRGLFWLQALDEAPLSFLVVDPLTVVDELAVDLRKSDQERIRGFDPDRLTLLSIVTLPETPEGQATVNLQGLVVLDPGTREGCQIVLPESPYGIHWPLDLGRLKKAS